MANSTDSIQIKKYIVIVAIIVIAIVGFGIAQGIGAFTKERILDPVANKAGESIKGAPEKVVEAIGDAPGNVISAATRENVIKEGKAELEKDMEVDGLNLVSYEEIDQDTIADDISGVGLPVPEYADRAFDDRYEEKLFLIGRFESPDGNKRASALISFWREAGSTTLQYEIW